MRRFPHSSRGARRRLRSPARWGLRALWWTPAAAVAWWSGRPYVLDLIAQFGPHASVALGLGCVGALVIGGGRRPGRLLGAELGLAAAAALGLCLLVSRGGAARMAAAPPAEGDGRIVRVVVYNAKGEATRADDEFDAWLRGQDADVVCIIDQPWGYEASRAWITERYPHSVGPERGLSWSILILSRHALTPGPLADQSGEHMFSFPARRAVTVRPEGGSPFVFTATHPPSPRTLETWRASLAEARRDGLVARRAHESTGLPVIVAGDFNSGATGAVHAAFGRASGLATWPTLFGRGTWPAGAPALVGIPIDRVWATPEVGLRAARVGPRFRSDHRPVTVDLFIPGRAQSAGERAGGGDPSSSDLSSP